MTYKQLDLIADSINPLLVLLAIALPFLLKIERPWLFLLRTGAALLVVEVLAKVIRSAHLVEGKFPSTHWAFALCVVTAVIALKIRAAVVLVPLVLAYGWLILYQKYHTLIELVGALYAIPVTVLFFLPYMRRREPVAALDA